MFILYIFYFTDIIPDIIPGSCSDDETNVANVYLIKSLYCKSFIVPISFRGRCSDDEANVANVYLYLAIFCFFFVLRVCAKLVDTYHCDMSFVRC